MLTGVGTQCLRNYFLTVHPNWSNKPSDAKALRKGALVLQNYEEAKFNTGNIDDWDVALLVRVLRYSAVSSAELKRNPDKDKALCKIKEIRNNIIGHKANEKISNADFTLLWEDLKRCLLVIGGSEEDINDTLVGKKAKLLKERVS